MPHHTQVCSENLIDLRHAEIREGSWPANGQREDVWAKQDRVHSQAYALAGVAFAKVVPPFPLQLNRAVGTESTMVTLPVVGLPEQYSSPVFLLVQLPGLSIASSGVLDTTVHLARSLLTMWYQWFGAPPNDDELGCQAKPI